MKFITRELYDAMQAGPDTPESDAADARWELQTEAYQRHLTSIRDELSDSMREFCDISFHDGIIRAVRRPSDKRLVLEIDATHNPWGPRGVFLVQFDGVMEVEGGEDIIDEWWLYEEIDLHHEAGFEYCVLLDKSQLRVVANEVTFSKKEAS